ncbi:unnamed protein product [Closterium sp. Yama58-4]|nr:unnamed protein product [Closterium sp. Yama58-4]
MVLADVAPVHATIAALLFIVDLTLAIVAPNPGCRHRRCLPPPIREKWRDGRGNTRTTTAESASQCSSASLLPRAVRKSKDGGRRASHIVSASAAAEGSADSSVAVAPAASDAAAPAATVPDVCTLAESLELRVGRIVRAWKHPEADSLYVEEVDVGEESGPRTICSGLVKYIPEADLQDRLVVVLANLKPRNMRGVKSNGMLLAASDDAHENVQLLSPPVEAAPGERIWFGAEADGASQAAAATPNQLQKKKIWEAVQPQLKTTEDCAATLLDKPMRVASGVITCKSLAKANIG